MDVKVLFRAPLFLATLLHEIDVNIHVLSFEYSTLLRCFDFDASHFLVGFSAYDRDLDIINIYSVSVVSSNTPLPFLINPINLL